MNKENKTRIIIGLLQGAVLMAIYSTGFKMEGFRLWSGVLVSLFIVVSIEELFIYPKIFKKQTRKDATKRRKEE